MFEVFERNLMKGSKEKQNVTASFNILKNIYIFSLLRQCDYSKYSVVSINKLGINQIENHTHFLMHKVKYFIQKVLKGILLFYLLYLKIFPVGFLF